LSKELHGNTITKLRLRNCGWHDWYRFDTSADIIKEVKL